MFVTNKRALLSPVNRNNNMNNKKKKWNPPGWPWELELIILIFFVGALMIPLMLETPATGPVSRAAATAKITATDPIRTQIGFLKNAMIASLYLVHLILGFVQYNRLTVSLMHFLSPTLFAYLAYNRISHTPGVEDSLFRFMDGSTWQYIVIGVVMPALTLLLMHLRRLRYMSSYEDTAWELDTPAAYDRGYLTLLGQMMPLFYPPSRYRVCKEGLVVEGWHYAMPVGFADINRIMRIPASGVLRSGYYHAGSLSHLVRIDLIDSPKPLFIAPRDPDAFVKCCQPYIARRPAAGKATLTKPGTVAGTGPGHTPTG